MDPPNLGTQTVNSASQSLLRHQPNFLGIMRISEDIRGFFPKPVVDAKMAESCPIQPENRECFSLGYILKILIILEIAGFRLSDSSFHVTQEHRMAFRGY